MKIIKDLNIKLNILYNIIYHFKCYLPVYVINYNVFNVERYLKLKCF